MNDLVNLPIGCQLWSDFEYVIKQGSPKEVFRLPSENTNFAKVVVFNSRGVGGWFRVDALPNLRVARSGRPSEIHNRHTDKYPPLNSQSWLREFHNKSIVATVLTGLRHDLCTIPNNLSIARGDT